MKTSVPIYLEERDGEVLAHPLFDHRIRVSAPTVERALQLLQPRLLMALRELAVEPDQRGLAVWLSTPVFEHEVLSVRLRHAGQPQAGQVMVVRYTALGRTLAFAPRWPCRHFEAEPGVALTERVAQVFQQWLAEDEGPLLEELLCERLRARVRVLELDWEPAGATKIGRADAARLGGDTEHFDGGTELAKVGVLLTGRERALAREAEVAALAVGLRAEPPGAVLLLGASGVGKTRVLTEFLATQPSAGVPIRVWHVAPARVISGMSYLGQWEARWLAILRHAATRKLVLYFDDLLGLFSAGRSSGSSLTLGDLLLPWLVDQRVRVLGEITPEAWRVLRERRRAFADQFQIVTVPPPDPRAQWRILSQLLRELEGRHRVRYTLDAVPTALALAERYHGQRDFPGRIAEVLETLSARAVGQTLGRHEVIGEFIRRTGSAASLVDLDQPLSRAEIETALGAELKGQPQAIRVLADVLLRAKAGLNDPGRPLATLLLLGPTGVGKTACAKALARYLGGSRALIRIDLNEYAEAGDAARLVGTFAAPDGVLTAAIRRQPSSVVLLDEIEKAAPDVFDLLLSLLDEGRLTDAHGRVAHFRQAVIVMTSNLGAREAARQLGFAAPAQDRATYLDAARRFFRPEFVNRIDHVLPFTPLGDAELRAITEQAVAAVLQRSGLKTRPCLIDLDPAAIDALMVIGRDDALGARALKRGIERALVQPLARALAATRLDALSRIRLGLEAGELRVETTALDYADAVPLPAWEAAAQARVDARLAAIEAELDAHPGRGPLRLDGIDAAQTHYGLCREQLRVVLALSQASEARPARGGLQRLPRARGQLKFYGRQFYAKAVQASRADLERQQLAWWDEAHAEPPPAAAGLLRELAWLELLLRAPRPETHRLSLRPLGVAPPAEAEALAEALAAALATLTGCLAVRVDGADLIAEGYGLGALLAAECGYWLRRDDGLALIEVSGPRPAQRILRLSRGHRHLDLRHGLEIDQLKDAEALRRFLLQGLLVDAVASPEEAR